MARLRVTIDEAKCIASGQCVLSVPAMFDQREKDGIAQVLTSDLPPDLVDAVRQAARLCPSQAIGIEQE